MSADPFDRRLEQVLKSSPNDPYNTSYEWLKEIAGSIERQLNRGPNGALHINVEIEPGFQADIGQQLRINIRIPEKQVRDTLFRAYIPRYGLPIQLDLYGEEPKMCNSRDDLEEKILEFMQQIKDRIVSYRDFARQ
jgi:hypothetical protein